jgi:hypothetical protein
VRIDFVVLVLQAVSILTVWAIRLLPAGRWADRMHLVCCAALIGLGLSAILCAFYSSIFALFGGVSLVILLMVMNLGAGPEHARDSTLDSSSH